MVSVQGLGALGQVELGEGEVAGLGDFEVDVGTGDDGNRVAGALDDGGFVGADEAVGGGLGEGALEEAAAEALGSLGEDHEFAGDGRGDDGSVGGALDLLDGVDGGQADDGRAVGDDGVDGAVDGRGVDERAHGIVDEDNVVFVALEGGEGVGYGLLAVFAASDDVDAVAETEFLGVFGDLDLYALDVGGAYGDVDGGDARNGGEGAQGVNEDGESAQFEELLGLGGGHACAEAGGGK